jgi:hypothetical protein
MDEKILQHYRNWLEEYQRRSENENRENVEDQPPQQVPVVPQQVTNEDPVQPPNENEIFLNFPIDSHDSVKVFENNQIEVFVKKSFHQRQKRFRLDDSLFHVKIKVKENATQPLLFDLLDVLEKVFTFILQNIQTFFNPNDINEVYLTLFQSPMINGLNTPAVRLQDPKDVVQRVLDMLFRYLRSENNINLELNDTFTVYVHVLSIDHVQFKKKNPKPKVQNRRKKYGTNSSESNRLSWAIEVPNGFTKNPNIFQGECFLTSIVLGHLQNEYFKSNKKDRRFIYAQNINSKRQKSKNYAGKIILKELTKLKKELNISQGPHEIESIASSICNHLNCQIFIFSGFGNSTNLKRMFPKTLDDSLEPIYLFETQVNHVIFIRHISVFFSRNRKICIYCKKSFKSSRFLHRCDRY